MGGHLLYDTQVDFLKRRGDLQEGCFVKKNIFHFVLGGSGQKNCETERCDGKIG